ncbi:hypothetical protein [Duganella vulcania]|uniref:Uncharacterized protein n=1 Tax=Duganella vulcania TaxID=2692166 RepID=A0A845GHJ7_9BURK|nr:hypothetical protein [Duganella vulcania]MYM92776.1 hypothetical protein [Duganella vulcania]
MRYFIISWVVSIAMTVAGATGIWGMNFANILFGLTGGFLIGLVSGITVTEAKFGLKQIRAGAANYQTLAGK